MDSSTIYKNDFVSEKYVQLLMSNDEHELRWVTEDFYHKLFNEGKLHGKTLLDVGCGPLIRPALSASAHVSEIYFCDLLEENRKMIERWLNQDDNSPDFSNQFNHVAQLEGKIEHKYLEERVRRAIKGVFSCDILAVNPLYPRPIEQFDIVTSSYCLCSFSNESEYFLAKRNIAKLLKPGGRLALVETLSASTFELCGKPMPGACVDADKLARSLVEAQLEVLQIEEIKFNNTFTAFKTDMKGSIIALAVKPT